MNKTLVSLIENNEEFTSERLPSLYSDFDALRSTNADGFHANLTTWHRALSKGLKLGKIDGNEDRLVLRTGTGLLENLRIKELGTPSAIEFLIHDGVTNGSIVPLDFFMSSATSIYRRNWLSKPWHMLHWGMQQIGFGSKESMRPTSGYYVFVDILEEFGSRVMAALNDKTGRINRIMPLDLFVIELSTILGLPEGISSHDLKALLVFLSRDKNFLAFDNEVVKIGWEDGLDLTISELDRDIVAVQKLLGRLTSQVQQLTHGIERHAEAARMSVSQNNRSAALRHLKTKKLHEEMLAKRTSMLLQVEAAMAKIEEAADHVEFIRTMQQTTSALRTLNAESGGMENVENVVEAFNKEMANAEDMTSAISQASGGFVVDETGIDDELAALETSGSGEVQEDGSHTTEQLLAKVDPTPRRIPGDAVAVGTTPELVEASSNALNRLSLVDENTAKDGERVAQLT